MQPPWETTSAPRPSVPVSESATPSLVRHAQATPAEVGCSDGCAGLLAHLATVADPRLRRGVRHRLVSLPTIAAAAVLAAARSFTAIGEWAADASQEALAALGVRPYGRTGRHVVPHEATVRRALQTVDADQLDRAVATWLSATCRPTVSKTAPVKPAAALDGKTIPGARDHDDPRPDPRRPRPRPDQASIAADSGPTGPRQAGVVPGGLRIVRGS
jgi:hypothetical protein